MARSKGNSRNKKAKGKVSRVKSSRSRSAITGRYVTAKHSKSSSRTTVQDSSGRRTSYDAGEFAERFIERYPETFHELSKR